jgi:hypothetical protein
MYQQYKKTRKNCSNTQKHSLNKSERPEDEEKIKCLCTFLKTPTLHFTFTRLSGLWQLTAEAIGLNLINPLIHHSNLISHKFQ